MAGNYSDVPNNRIAYDAIGTQMFWPNIQTAVGQGTLNGMNDESLDSTLYMGQAQYGQAFLFLPEAYNITHICPASYTNSGSISVEYSTNSTNGVDGTWTSGTWNYSHGATTYRDAIYAATWNNVKAFRIGVQGGPFGGHNAAVSYFHIYGAPAVATAQRLSIWHPTLDQRIGGAAFDWGDTPRSSTADKTFRVKNQSSTLTANNIVLQFTSLTDTTPNVAAQHYVSSNGTDFFGTLNIGSLAPGAISSVMTVRRVTPSNATLSLWAARLMAVPGSWT